MAKQSHTTRREFLKVSATTAVGGMLAGLLGRYSLAEGVSGRSNIVLIMADDLGYECLGSSGGTSYQTPNLDALAATGTRFEHCYCTPVCSPSRVQIMTGRYGFRNYKGWGVLDPNEKTFGQVLREAGYATCVSGKWQLCRFDEPENADHPYRAGFDEHCVWTWHYQSKKPSRYWDPLIWQNGKLRDDLQGQYGPDVHCEFVMDFIRRNRDRPFFAYYPTNLVHSRFVPTPDSEDQSVPNPNRKKSRRTANKSNFPHMVTYLDKCVGRVVETLDRLGLREKTLILFTGDNGTPRGIESKMHELIVPGGKGEMTDTGTHVPLIANWSGTVPAGRVRSDPVDFSDFLPTLCEVTGAPLPEGVTIDGRSFLPQLRGEPGKPRDWVYIQLNEKRAVRGRRWKLHHDGRLYDMPADPFEESPITPGEGGEEAAAARKRLQAVLAELK